MKRNSLFLMCFFTIASGFIQAADHQTAQQDHKKHHPATNTLKVDDAKELQRPLDLTIPFKATEDAGENQQSDDPQNAIDTLFKPKPKNDGQPLRLKGGLLMSPEPETEKKKTVDGAGIVIDLR